MKNIISSKNKEKSKIEKIALKFLKSNQLWKKNYLNMNNKENIIQKKNYQYNRETEKDILTIEKEKESENIIKKENNLNEYNIKHSNYYSVNNNDKENGFRNIYEEEKEKARKKSQIPKKEKGIVPKIKGLEIIAKNHINKLNKESKDELSSNSLKTISNIIENSSQSSNYVNFDILNQVNSIYEELKKLFLNIQRLNYAENEKGKIEIYFKCKVLAYDYMQFLFGDEIPKIIKLFNYCLDIGKFIIYQMYFFLSIIYLDDSIYIDNTIEMSLKTILIYSSQNFNNFLNFVQNPQYSADPKKIINIQTKNKIIISILKLINPNIPTNSQIKQFMTLDIDKEKSNNNLKKIGKFPLNCLEEIGTNKSNKLKKINKKERYNSLGIIYLLSILKENRELTEKLNQIEKKVLILYEQKNTDNNNINNTNQITNNQNLITSSLSSMNMNYSKSNNNSSNKNRLSNMNKLFLPNLNPNKNYKLFLIFELDETLVHYCEEKDNCSVKVRCGVEDCFNKIYDFCEITIVSTSSKEYTDIVVDTINKKKTYIQNRIYKELFDEDENFDLSLINRDMNKCIFICHEEEFFNAPKNNILQLTEFNGEENDREIIFLCKELMRIKNDEIKDVTQILLEISNNVIV